MTVIDAINAKTADGQQGVVCKSRRIAGMEYEACDAIARNTPQNGQICPLSASHCLRLAFVARNNI